MYERILFFPNIKILFFCFEVSGFRSKRIKLPRDQLQQDQNRGFAFVTFDSYSDAKEAKERLHGHPYGTNILHCEWSRNYLNFLKANPEVTTLHSFFFFF